MGLNQPLVYLDACTVIYFVEAHPKVWAGHYASSGAGTRKTYSHFSFGRDGMPDYSATRA